MSGAKRVLDVGSCAFDHGAIRALLEEQFQACVLQAHALEDALQLLRDDVIDLVLVNRRLDRDHSQGLDIIRAIKADPELAATPVMMITNFAEHQQQAVEAGAEPGFGKAALEQPQTRQLLARFLQ